MNSAYQVVFRNALLALVVGLVSVAPAWAAAPGMIVVQVDKPGAKISPLLYGLMTEDFAINDAGSTWTHTFPGNSIAVIRFKTK